MVTTALPWLPCEEGKRPDDRLRLCQRLLEAVPGVVEKSDFGAAYTAVNGNMYSMISKRFVR